MRPQIRIGRIKLLQLDAPEPFDQDARRAIGEFHHLGQARNASHRIEIFRCGFGNLVFALQHRPEQTVACHDIIDQFEAGTGFNQQGHNSSRENDDVGKTKNREFIGQGTCRNLRADFGFFSFVQNADKLGLWRWVGHHSGLFPAFPARFNHAHVPSLIGTFLDLVCGVCNGGTSMRKKPFK